MTRAGPKLTEMEPKIDQVGQIVLVNWAKIVRRWCQNCPMLGSKLSVLGLKLSVSGSISLIQNDESTVKNIPIF